jgi:GTPase SAR1 family protein
LTSDPNIVFVGDDYCGKRSLISAFYGRKYEDEEYLDSNKYDDERKSFTIDNNYYRCRTFRFSAAPERKQQRIDAYKKAHCIVVCMDVTNKTSMHNVVNFWNKEIDENRTQPVGRLLVCCKSDVPDFEKP